MRGTLHKTENGWQVWYHAKEDLFYGNTGVRILPILDHGYVNGPGLSESDEGQEVEFEIIKYPNPPHNPTYHSIDIAAKLIDKAYVPMKGGEGWDKILDKAIQDKATRPLTEDDSWIKMKEGDITVNFKPMPEFDDPKYPEVKIICPKCKYLMPCECNLPRQTNLLNSIRANPLWDTIIKEFHIATQQVEKGAPPLIFECWLVNNYNPPTKKQD
jgi:hypothetical protein